MPVNSTWYRFTELRDQKLVEFEQGKMPTRDLCLAKFSTKFQNQAPWEEDKLKDTAEEGKVEKTITEALKSGFWIVRDSNFSWKINYGKKTTLETAKR